MGPNSTWLVSLQEREVWTQTGIERRPYEDTGEDSHLQVREATEEINSART